VLVAALDELEMASQQQHQRYYELFGQSPAGGEGFQDLSSSARGVSQQAQDIRNRVIGLNFSTTVMHQYVGATLDDHLPLEDTATTTAAAAKAADASAQVNLRGAEAVAANSRAEAAAIAAIPDPDSPAGLAQGLGVVQTYQSKSATAVQQSAAEEQAIGQQAASAATQRYADGKPIGQVKMVDSHTGSPTDPLQPQDLGELLGAPPGAGLSPQLQQMLLGGNPANLTGKGLVDNVQRFVQSLPENDPRTAYLLNEVIPEMQRHIDDLEYAKAHCTTEEWIRRTSNLGTGILMTAIGGLTAETGVGMAVAGASGLNTLWSARDLLQCVTGSK